MRLRVAIGAGVALLLALASSPAAPSGASPQPSPAAVKQQIPAVQAPSALPSPFAFHGLPSASEGNAIKVNPKTYDKGHGPNLSTRVVLTYDDCPDDLANYQAVLAFAQQHNIGLVIAPTGECYGNFKKKHGVDIAALARQHGQYVINHSKTHPNLTELTYAQAKAEITGDIHSDYGRPPYGARDKTVDKAYTDAGMRQWLWDVDTNDWKKGKTRQVVVSYVVANACAGCTVLMHLQHKGFDVTAIAQMRDGLAKRDLHLCRAFRGWDNAGPVEPAPVNLGDSALAC